MEDVSLTRDVDTYVPDLELNSWLSSVALPLQSSLHDSYQWLKHAHELYQQDQLSSNDWISWAVCYASRTVVIPLVTSSFMLLVQ